MKTISFRKKIIIAFTFLMSANLLSPAVASIVSHFEKHHQSLESILYPMEKVMLKEVARSTVKITSYDESGKIVGCGSGFIVAHNGVIISNYHVVEEAKRVDIITNAGITYPLERIIEFDAAKDFVFLKIEDSGLPYLRLGKSKIVDVNERVIALGYPGGSLKHSVGTLDLHKREDNMKWLQHSASISLGSSGGPLFNTDFEVIGINTAFKMGEDQLNFAIPIEYLKPLFRAMN